MISRCNGRFRSPGGRRRLSCLAASLALPLMAGGCAHKPLVQTRIERIELPASLPSCAATPAVPSIDAIAGPDGDNVLAVYIAKLESALRDCHGAMAEIREWAARLNQSQEN